ncbi:Fic family protein [Dyadobacter sp. 3J3]|uniref:Fic family protein n=1 Tax=Dyadobacter sp. 3J3 TaxID=2606600 RepID=UPI00135C93C8|nr:Fic family protein [Dyadobacter sp. 3J3]
MGSIEKAMQLKEQLDSLRPISLAQELKIMQKFRLDWNYHSNNLEGNSLTYGETKALILFGLTAQGKPLKDHIEIEGHNEAIEWILDIIKGEYPITESFIREIHSLLLKESYTVNAITAEGLPTTKRVEIGKYKSQPNHVLTSTGEIFRFATPEETPAMMGELIDWYRGKIVSADKNPILIAAEFHYRFIRIHPFDDGNGRTARILMNFILMQFQFPPVIIKTEEKNKYFFALRQADSGLIEAFVNYIADNLVNSLEIMIRGAKGESIEESDDLDKELAILEMRLNRGDQEVEKTVQLIHELFDKSVIPLIHQFLEGTEKFNKFYIQNSVFVGTDTVGYTDKIKGIAEIQQRININTTSFRVANNYGVFKHSVVGNFDFQSNIQVLLNDKTYIVRNERLAIRIEKSYNTQLTEEEINLIVNEELKRHKDFIEQKMKNA